MKYNKKFNVRHYSTSSDIKVIPLFTFKLTDNFIDTHKEKLKNKAGIYSFKNAIDGKQYIGSAKDLYLRFNEHIKGKKSNLNLQRALKKHGLINFEFSIYEYFTYDKLFINGYTLVDLETSYINKFNLKELYNFNFIANSMLGYKHTKEAISKMMKRFEDKKNHPMSGKKHSKNVLKSISKPGELNPMFGKKHSKDTINLISSKMSKYPLGVGIYDLNDNLIKNFKNNTELAIYLSISKVTVAKYLNKKLIFKNKFIFKPIN